MESGSRVEGEAVPERPGEPVRFSLRARARSFRFAFRGLAVLLRSQHNSWIHLLATACVAALALWLSLPATHWCWLALAVGAVWSAEAFNTALERLADATRPDLDPLVEEAKDAAAAGVLIAAIAAVVIGLLILGPPLLTRLRELL